MKITIFIGGLSGGGAERVCCNIAGFLSEKGHKVTILSMADDEATYGLNPKVNRVNLITEKERKGFLFNALLRYKRLATYMSKNDCDAYIVMLPITILMLISLRHRTNAKIIASERNMPTLYPKWQQLAMKLIAGKADGWVFQTQEQRIWYGSSLKDVKFIIIPNAINDQFIKEPYIGIREKKVITVGRLMPQKNQELLIRAYAKIAKKYPEYHLYIYGDGPLKNFLIQIAHECGVEDCVIFKGFMKDIYTEIRKSSVFVLSSDFEGMPNALMESMALGIPCISTDCGGGGASFLIDNMINGILVPKGDVVKLAEALDLLLSDSELSYSIGVNSSKIAERLHPGTIYTQWLNFVKKIIEPNK